MFRLPCVAFGHPLVALFFLPPSLFGFPFPGGQDTVSLFSTAGASAGTVRSMSAHNHPPLSCRFLPGLLSCLAAVWLAAATCPRPAEGTLRDGAEKRVVILYSHPHDFPATELTERGIREAFAREGRLAVQLFSEYLAGCRTFGSDDP